MEDTIKSSKQLHGPLNVVGFATFFVTRVCFLPNKKLHSAHGGSSSLNHQGDRDVWEVVMVVVCLANIFTGI